MINNSKKSKRETFQSENKKRYETPCDRDFERYRQAPAYPTVKQKVRTLRYEQQLTCTRGSEIRIGGFIKIPTRSHCSSFFYVCPVSPVSLANRRETLQIYEENRKIPHSGRTFCCFLCGRAVKTVSERRLTSL